MKKLLVLISVSLMCFVFGSNSLAVTAYLDFMPNGEVDYLKTEFDLSGQIMGIDYQANSFKVGFEYFNGSVDVGPFDVDLSQTELKGGYKIADGLYVSLSMVDGDFEDEASYDSVLLGLNLTTKISKELLLEGSAAMSLSGSVNYDYYKELDADFLSFKGKLTYFLSNNLGASVGYRKTAIEDEEDDEIINSGMTLGVTYKF